MIPDPAQDPLFDEAQIGLLRDAIGPEDLLTMLLDLPPAAQHAVDEIAAAVNVGDIRGARRSAHTLKGCAGSFGAARLASLAAEIELELPSVDEMHQRLPALAECLRQTAVALEQVAQGATVRGA
jgi:HPt (histidine-containing phosphotransfer) domain-containing protein